MSVDAQEELFIKRFIVSDKQERYLTFLSNPKTRSKFLSEFSHSLAIKGSLATEIASRDRKAESLEAQLRRYGAGAQVYVLSPYPEFDRKWFALREVLEAILPRNFEAVLCCLPGELAFYLAEDGAYILRYPSEKQERAT